MICDPAEAERRVEASSSRCAARTGPFTLTNTPYAWHWEATYPQPYGYTDDPQKPEQVNVSVAQNLRQSDGKVTNMSSGEARGRSFHDGRQDTAARRGELRPQLPGAMAARLRAQAAVRDGDRLERVDRRPLGRSPAGRWSSWTSSTRNSAATSSR